MDLHFRKKIKKISCLLIFLNGGTGNKVRRRVYQREISEGSRGMQTILLLGRVGIWNFDVRAIAETGDIDSFNQRFCFPRSHDCGEKRIETDKLIS